MEEKCGERLFPSFSPVPPVPVRVRPVVVVIVVIILPCARRGTDVCSGDRVIRVGFGCGPARRRGNVISLPPSPPSPPPPPPHPPSRHQSPNGGEGRRPRGRRRWCVCVSHVIAARSINRRREGALRTRRFCGGGGGGGEYHVFRVGLPSITPP